MGVSKFGGLPSQQVRCAVVASRKKTPGRLACRSGEAKQRCVQKSADECRKHPSCATPKADDSDIIPSKSARLRYEKLPAAVEQKLDGNSGSPGFREKRAGDIGQRDHPRSHCASLASGLVWRPENRSSSARHPSFVSGGRAVEGDKEARGSLAKHSREE